MKLNKELRKVCRQLVRSSFTGGRLDGAKVSTIVQSVADKKPRYYLDILKNYQRQIRLEVAKTHAVVESALPLSPEAAGRITGDLRAKHAADLTTEFKVAPDLIGGLRIKIGSDVWDGSVRHRLDRLAQHFNEV